MHMNGRGVLVEMVVTDGAFEEATRSTLGMDFKIKELGEGEQCITLQIWDTAGQEQFKTITSRCSSPPPFSAQGLQYAC